MSLSDLPKFEQRPQRLQNSDFQCHFSALKIKGIVLTFFSVKTTEKFFTNETFETFDF